MTGNEDLKFFTNTYKASRIQFRDAYTKVRAKWPKAMWIAGDEARNGVRSFDAIKAAATDEKRRLLIINSGLHGIEGFVGGAIAALFIEEYMPSFNEKDTGLVIIHPANPEGMAGFRRQNSANVDLNRNFLNSVEDFASDPNGDYARIHAILNPEQAISSKVWANARFLLGLVRALVLLGPRKLEVAALLGQYTYPMGIYYGGRNFQPETLLLREFILEEVRNYSEIVLVDLHSGYGPSYQMTMVNSPLETQSPDSLRVKYGYPLVTCLDSDAFFPIRGDMLDYFYSHIGKSNGDLTFFATTFEFGTMGESMLAGIRSLRATVLENQLHHHGSSDASTVKWIRSEFERLFTPADPLWRSKAIKDARNAFKGILSAHGFIDESG
jgi:hypothetical protein